MADEPMSAAAALIAVNEDERQIQFTENEVDAFARKVEDKVTDLVGGLSNWWSGVQTQSMNALHMAKDHIDQSGGILNAARSEIGKWDAELQSHSDRARELSRSTAEPLSDGVPFEITDKDDEVQSLSKSLQETPAAASPERNSIWHLLESHAWNSFRQLASHSQVERIQSQLTSLANNGSDSQTGLHSTLKDADSLARKYMQSGESTLQNVSKDFQKLVHDIMQKSSSKKDVSESTNAAESVLPTGTQGAETLHVVGSDDDDDFVWDDDDDLAVTGNAHADLLDGDTTSASTSEPKALPAPTTPSRNPIDNDSDWE
ncbi:hypothetical protein MCAP1_000160 [Malassezia caprae]|uniref:BSD domain-containing protein n=1 Tax=Malassezia caprae TaxID=1381934 RepID=A0AAF0ITK5_9BASI|nr:hypothetical protein MCAP1_000160 [Malassezia caprae]